MSKTIRLTAAQAMVCYIAAQQNDDGARLIEGCWAIFGHGNIARLSEALHAHRDVFPTWRGHGGAAFLIWYGVKSLLSALRSNEALVADSSLPMTDLIRTLVACLAITWLNPHVYLDTAVLLGTISTQFTHSQGSFAIGAILGSFVFFFALGYGATKLRPVFERPTAWRVLETLIAAGDVVHRLQAAGWNLRGGTRWRTSTT